MSEPVDAEPPISGSILSGLPPATPRSPWETAVRRVRYGTVVVVALAWLFFPPARQPGDHPPVPICATAAGDELRADVDGNGQVDEIHDPYSEGVGSVVLHEGDAHWSYDIHRMWDAIHRFRILWSALAPQELGTRGTFGDFDGDGHVDLALFTSQRDTGDLPNSDMPTHEVRYGPLARDLTSARTSTIHIRAKSFVYGVRATDLNHDGRAELQIAQSMGDGGTGRYVGRQDGDGVTVGRLEDYLGANGDWSGFEHGWRDFGICPS